MAKESFVVICLTLISGLFFSINSSAQKSGSLDKLELKLLLNSKDKGGLRIFSELKWSEFEKAITPIGTGIAKSATIDTVKVKAIQLEDSPSIVIELEFPEGLKNTSRGKWELLSIGVGIDVPASYKNILSFRMSSFAPPESKIVPSAGPVVFYDDEMNTMLISPMDNFLVSLIQKEGGELFAGLEGELDEIPHSFKHPVIIYYGKGMRKTFAEWGKLLRRWHNKEVPDLYADVQLSYLGYWTDNGSYYYYKTEKGKNYEDTLLAVKRYADEIGVPFGYFQIDSWWYPKGNDKYSKIKSLAFIVHFFPAGGALCWEAKPENFPNGLKAFQKKLGLPLVAHSRWFDQNNYYRDRYKFIDGEGSRKPALPVEKAFWEMMMTNAKEWGIVVYEQDWLDTQFKGISYLRKGVYNAENWIRDFTNSAREKGLTIQFCMANPGMFMQAVKIPNVTTVRASDDYMAGLPKELHWVPFTKASMLAWACGLYPWKDTYLSSSGQRTIRDEKYSFEETLISILSATMVGPGDKIGHINKSLLLKTCRADGILLKPDEPALPIDKVFLENDSLYTITTHSSHRAGKWYYIAGLNIFPSKYKNPSLSFQELEIDKGNYIAYDWKQRKVFNADKGIEYPRELKKYESAYIVLCPKLENGMAFIGEVDKFITASRKRFASIELRGNDLKVMLSGVPSEEIRLMLYSDSQPQLSVENGEKFKEEFHSGVYIVQLKLVSENVILKFSKKTL